MKDLLNLFNPQRQSLDFDGIRIGLAPLYTSYTDVHDGLAALRDLL